MNPLFVVTQTQSITQVIGNILIDAIPAILGIFSALIGLGILLTWIINWIGSPSMIGSVYGANRHLAEIHDENRRLYAQMRNEELLGYGTKVQRVDNWS